MSIPWGGEVKPAVALTLSCQEMSMTRKVPPIRAAHRIRAFRIGLRVTRLCIGLTIVPTITLAQGDGAAVDARQGDTPTALVETYRDWVVRCDTASAGERQCEMAQEMRQSDGRLVFATLIQAAGGGAARVIFVAPFGLALAEGLRLDANGFSSRTVAFSTCYATGCVAETTLDAGALGALSDAEGLAVVMTPVSGDPLDLTVSLAGFRGAWRRLEAMEQ